MKNFKKVILLFMFMLSFVMLMPSQVEAAVKISKKSVTLTAGQSITLKIKGTKKKVKWSSNKKSVATVNSKGKVTAKKTGKATITAKIGKKKYTCKVTVKKKAKFSEKKAISKMTYKTTKTSWGLMYLVKNNYSYSISLTLNALFYNNSGNVIDTDGDEAYCIEPSAEYPLFIVYPTDSNGDLVNFSKITLKWSADDASYNVARSNLKYSANYGNEKVIVAITNTSKKPIDYRAVVIIYKNGALINYCPWGICEVDPGETQYLECDYPYIDGYGICTPDAYKVYIG